MSTHFIQIKAVAVPNYKKKRFVVLFGESQTGKSTLVNCVLGNNIAKIGDGTGKSVTQITQIYKIPKYDEFQMMDSPGGLDTNLKSDQQTLKEIEYAIAKTADRIYIDAFILTESLLDGTMQLTRNLQRLKNIFGQNVVQSIVVCGTKPAVSTILGGNVRIDAVTKECARLNLKFMLFESYSNYQSKALMNGTRSVNQINQLIHLVDAVNPYQMNQVIKIRQVIKARAQQLMNAAPIQYVAKTVYYNENYADPYTVREAYKTIENYSTTETYPTNEAYTVRESYQTQEPYQATESYSVSEPYQVQEQYTVWVRDVIYKDTNFFKWGSKPKKSMEMFLKQEQEQLQDIEMLQKLNLLHDIDQLQNIEMLQNIDQLINQDL
jgi:GTP-binding protein EngB required for normal cell division